MSDGRGRSLELFFVDGRPEGMLTARMFNWTGQVLVAPRTQLPEALKRPEAAHTGVYLLLGEKEGEDCIYVGEGDDMSARIRSHDSAKDWWQTAVFISTQANTLNKAQVRYLEARLLQEVRLPTDNGTSPTPQGLSEAARADMEAFLGNLFVVLPAARIDAFLTRTRPTATIETSKLSEAVRFVLHTPKHNITARAELVNGEFVVLRGSDARREWSSETQRQHTYSNYHDQLLNSGVLRLNGELCIFEENYAFPSVSAAAAVINGRPSNGRTEWKLEGTNKTYAEWEEDQLRGGTVDAEVLV
jgi:Domain of unknown function (DUF4357)